MNDYTASIEKQNEELKQKLGDAERKRDFYRKQFCKEWGMHIHTLHGKIPSMRLVTDRILSIPWACLKATHDKGNLSGFTIWRMYGQNAVYGCRAEKDRVTKKLELIVFRGAHEYSGYILRKKYKSFEPMFEDIEKYMQSKKRLRGVHKA
jgi:hypothetical protein